MYSSWEERETERDRGCMDVYPNTLVDLVASSDWWQREKPKRGGMETEQRGGSGQRN